MNKVLVVATHPDDETLGCGGTLLKHKKNGDEIYWMIVTKMLKKYGYTHNQISKKNKEIEFYRNYEESGITDEAIKESLKKFDQKYQKFNKQLRESKFLKGDEISILDIAWFIYTYRLYISGFPFREKYPNVLRWYVLLFSRKEFRKELNDNLLFKILRFIALIRASIAGKTIKKLMN